MRSTTRSLDNSMGQRVHLTHDQSDPSSIGDLFDHDSLSHSLPALNCDYCPIVGLEKWFLWRILTRAWVWLDDGGRWAASFAVEFAGSSARGSPHDFITVYFRNFPLSFSPPSFWLQLEKLGCRPFSYKSLGKKVLNTDLHFILWIL